MAPLVSSRTRFHPKKMACFVLDTNSRNWSRDRSRLGQINLAIAHVRADRVVRDFGEINPKVGATVRLNKLRTTHLTQVCHRLADDGDCLCIGHALERVAGVITPRHFEFELPRHGATYQLVDGASDQDDRSGTTGLTGRTDNLHLSDTAENVYVQWDPFTCGERSLVIRSAVLLADEVSAARVQVSATVLDRSTVHRCREHHGNKLLPLEINPTGVSGADRNRGGFKVWFYGL